MKATKNYSPKIKILSLVLSFLIIFYLVPISAVAEGLNNDMTVSDNSVSKNEENNIYTPEIYEVTELREENVKHFRLEDGSYVAAQYNYPVHYTNDNGQLIDIDNHFIESGGELSTGDARVKFAKKITGNGNIFTIHKNNTKITMGLVGANKKIEGVVTSTRNSDDNIENALGKLVNLENISSTIIYKDILDGVDIEYIIHSLNVKENIIVKNKKDNYSYTFTLELNNLTATLADDGSIYIDSIDGKSQYIIPAPVVHDNNGTYAPVGVSAYSLSEIGNGKFELNVTVASSWMNDDARAFPVTIDPTIGVPHGYTTDLDITSEAPSVSFEESFSLKVSSTWRSYWKTPSEHLPVLPSTAHIWKAELKLFGGGYNTYVGAYEISNDWDETLTWNKTISSNPQGLFSSNMLDYHKIGPGDNWYAFDLTEVAKKWYNGENNYGVGFKLVDGTDTTMSADFYSYEYYDDYDDRFVEPCFYVYYLDMSGLEDYYSISSHSVAGIGSGSVNLASGNLTFITNLVSTTDYLMPMTISAVYNSDMSGKYYNISNSFSAYTAPYMPYGFKLNISETIIEKSMRREDGSSTKYYILSDSDGTNHYFYYGSDLEYIDDSAQGRTFSKSTNEITITYKDQSKKTFTKMSSNPTGTEGGWVLSKITDDSGNSIIISLDDWYRPTKISLLPTGITTAIDMVTFTYGGGKLRRVQSPNSLDYVDFTYSSNVLTGLTFGNSKASSPYYVTQLFYNSVGNLVNVQNNTLMLRTEYTWNNNKISTVSERSSTGLGQQVAFGYGDGYADIRSTGNDEALNTTDDVITRYVFDAYGRSICVYSMSSDGTKIYGATSGSYDDSEKSKNSIKSSAILSGVDTGDIIENTSRTDGNFAVIQSDVTTNESDGTYVQTVFYEEDVASLMFSNANMEYIISGFGYSNCIIQNEATDFSLGINVYYYQGAGADDEVVEYRFSFADVENVWQYVCGKFSCYIDDSPTYRFVRKIEIVCSYYGHPGTSSSAAYARFKDIALTNFTANSGFDYSYNEATGDVERKENSIYQELYTYYGENDGEKANRIKCIANNYGEKWEYDYTTEDDETIDYERYYRYSDENNGFIIVSATAYVYNSYGLLVATSYLGANGGTITSENAYPVAVMNTQYEYDVNQNSKIFGALIKEIDSLGHITTYAYYPDTGYLAAQFDISSGTGYLYTYYNSGELKSVVPAVSNSSSGDCENVNYTYNTAGYLTSISTDSTIYNLLYDSFGNASGVSAGNNTLATYEYYPNNGKLKKINYGNGFSEEYVYNTLEMLSEIWYTVNGTRTIAFEYTYNADGTLREVADHLSGKNTEYKYDNRGRLSAINEKENGDTGYNNIYRATYDSENRVSSQTNIISYSSTSSAISRLLTTSYEYGTNGQIDSETHEYLSDNHKVSYAYDDFGRINSINSDFGSFDYTKQYTYVSEGYNTSYLVGGYTSTVNGTSKNYTYTYDSRGNITRVIVNGDSTSYTYDDLGQLTGESREGVYYTYTYDNAGNITSITKTTLNEDAGITPRPFAVVGPISPPPLYFIDTDTLTYSDSQWGDLLTSFNGHTITYDEIGNPLSYYNGASYTFTWTGRQLTGAVKGSNNLTFVYNDEGIRTSKTVNGVVHTYQLNGSQIVAESWEDKLIVYLYDASGSPIGMMYRTTSYAIDSFDIFWFEKNLQGDIVAVYNSAGTKVAYYTYTDAWGNHSVGYINLATNEGVQYNPFRYRGYYYDTETGFYYLKSRYYDPNTCRFISPDNEAVLTATPMALTDKNLYAYCDNNPVMRVDEDGEFWLQFGIGAAVGFVSGVIDFLQSGEELSWIEVAKIGVSTLSGGVTAVVGPVAGALISGIAYGVNSALSGNDSEEIIVDSFVGALTSGIGSGMQLATGRILAGNFVQSASKTKLKMFANSLGYVGKNYKNALSWTGEIMYDASVEYMDKPIAQFVGYSIAFVSERINALIPR